MDARIGNTMSSTKWRDESGGDVREIDHGGLLLEHHFILFAPTRVVLGPLDGEERRLEELLVRILLTSILLYKIVLEELLADPLVTHF